LSKLGTPAAGVLSGILFSLAFPPREWVLLLPIALVPWIAALAAERSRGRALLSGVLFGLAYWCASVPWIVYVVTRFGGQSLPLGILSLGILVAILAQWPALVAWGVAAIASPGSWKRFALFPLLWMASEHARSYAYGGFPWNLTGFALYRHPIWLQSASLWGVYGLGLLVAAVSALVAFAAHRRKARWLLAAGGLVLLVGIAGVLWLKAPWEPDAPSRSVALLQPNISQQARLSDGLDAENYATVIEQAREAARGRPDLLVIPESAFPIYWQLSSLLRRDLTGIAQDSGGFILFNDVDLEPDGRHYNAARLVSASGLEGPPYRKVHLVPFGEYVPLPGIFFFVRQVSTEIGEFSAAGEPRLLEAGAFRIGTGVCYEILYPVLSWKQVRRGANLLATISNDSWYGEAGAQAQHFAGAALRSVENRRYLLRAAVTGISGIVDEKGRIVAELPRERRGTINGTARLLTRRTIWSRWGFVTAGIADALAAAALLFGVARWRRERGRKNPLPAGTGRLPREQPR